MDMNLTAQRDLRDGELITARADRIATDVATGGALDQAALAGVRVASFYPWTPFRATGSWNRFSTLRQFLLDHGASVTMAFFEKDQDFRLKDVSVRCLREHTMFAFMPQVMRMIANTPKYVEMRQYSQMEVALLLRYEKSLYLQTASVGPWLDDIISHHDIVTCEYPFAAPLLSEYCKKWRKPLVVTSHDILYALHGKHSRATERLKEKEIGAMGLADALVFVNDSERKTFEQFGLHGTTVLNTSDVYAVEPGNEAAARDQIRTELQLSTPNYCLFVGSLHEPNVDAVAELRKIVSAMPAMTFIVAGTCAEPSREGNFVSLGFVPERQLDVLYRGAFAVVIPLRHGTGTSVKTFQAFTYGKAVVSTPAGVRGHSAIDGEQVLIVPTPADIPAALHRLSQCSELRVRLGRSARAHACTLDYRTEFRPYAEIINKLLHRAAGSTTAMSQGLVLVDNNLGDCVGHHFTYALSLKECCQKDQLEFRALIKSNAAASVCTGLDAQAIFAQGIHDENVGNPFPAEWGNLRRTYDFLHSSAVFAKELEAGLVESARSTDLVFLPNAMPKEILGLALLMARNPLVRQVRFVLMLRYSLKAAIGPINARKLARDSEMVAQYQAALERLDSVDTASLIRLATDSEQLAKEYVEITKRPIEVLPIPHTHGSIETQSITDVPVKTDQRLRIVYLGDAREEKGFELLPRIVRDSFANPAMRAVEFVLQTFISSPHHRSMRTPIEQLQQLKQSCPHVHLVQRSLLPQEYAALLESADIVLLPYDAMTYRSRTSGPFVEAISGGKPVVVPSESWMSLQLGQCKAGELFTSGDAGSATQALAKVVHNYAAAKVAADVLGARFREFHNPHSFVRALMRQGTNRNASPVL